MGQRWGKVKSSAMWRPSSWGMTKTFQGFKRSTQRVILMSLALGLFLGIIFTVSDLNHPWWENKSYIPNILAAITGFLVGAPVALVILATFTSEREEKATLDRVNRLSLVAWWAFRDLVNEFCSQERYEVISKQGRDIKTCYDETSAAIGQIIAYATAAIEHGADIGNDLTNKIADLRQIEPKFRMAVNAFTRTFNFQTRDEWAQLVGSWRVLDQYVRLQRLEQGLEWFDAPADSGLRKWMSREGNPLQELVDSVEIRLYTPDSSLGRVDTMRNALDSLAGITQMDDDNLGQYLLYTGNIFNTDRPIEYSKKCDAAYLFTLDLMRYISLVELEYWPRSQTAPKRPDTERELTMNEWVGSLQTPEGEQEFKKLFHQVAAEQYQDKLRRRPKGNRSGSDLRKKP
jgi:hypothetical protein